MVGGRDRHGGLYLLEPRLAPTLESALRAFSSASLPRPSACSFHLVRPMRLPFDPRFQRFLGDDGRPSSPFGSAFANTAMPPSFGHPSRCPFGFAGVASSRVGYPRMKFLAIRYIVPVKSRASMSSRKKSCVTRCGELCPKLDTFMSGSDLLDSDAVPLYFINRS